MTTANVSEDGQRGGLELTFCWASLTAGTHGQLIFISILNSFLAITASLGNALILVALRKESSLHPPSKLLLSNLAATDLCVGIISHPLFVIFLISVMNERWDICRYVSVTGFIADPIFCGVSLSTLTAISVDRLLALSLGLRYRQVVTLRRTYVIVIAFWVLQIVISMMSLRNVLIAVSCSILVASLCLATSIFSYTKIFFTLRHHQNQVQDHIQQPNHTSQLNIARYRNVVCTSLWLQFMLASCYLPDSIVVALMSIGGLSTPLFLAREYTVTLVYLNSSLNPILYCWKINEVKQAVKDTIRKVLRCPSIN